MKIEKDLQGVTLEITQQGFDYSSTETPRFWVKVKVVGEEYDSIRHNFSLGDKAFKFSLHNIRLMTGWAGESILELNPEDKKHHSFVGKKFKADIKLETYKGKTYPKIVLPQEKKSMSLEALKELDKKHKIALIENASNHSDDSIEEKEDIDIPF